MTSTAPATPATKPRQPTRNLSPLAISLRRLRRHRLGMAGLVILLFLYSLAIFADFLAPYHFDSQVRDLAWQPPTPLRFFDADGNFSLRPFVYPRRQDYDEYFNPVLIEDTTQKAYLRFFVQGDPYSIAPHRVWQSDEWSLFRIRLFGVDQLSATNEYGETYYTRLYLFGSDISGRDMFSRVIYASRISMTIGLVGASIVFIIGMLVGGTAGYFGGRTDQLLMSLCEMLMLLPGFYLLLILRFAFPANMDSVTIYFAVVFILALIGWAGFARIIRGMVLSLRHSDYVHAARAAGVGHFGIITRHLLPGTFSFAIVSLTMSIPGYILGESALSILGLGIMEPVPSWGNMLQRAMEIPELNARPWVLIPGAYIFAAVMGFNLLGDGLRDAFDPRAVSE